MRAEPALTDDKREFVVLGVSNELPDIRIYEEAPQQPPPRSVRIAWLTWADLADCDVHPRAAEFRRYLEWKRTYGQGKPL